MSSEEQTARGAINAADVAVSEGDFYRAEEALQKALRNVREQQSEENNADD